MLGMLVSSETEEVLDENGNASGTRQRKYLRENIVDMAKGVASKILLDGMSSAKAELDGMLEQLGIDQQ
jgi:hypothetical protein